MMTKRQQRIKASRGRDTHNPYFLTEDDAITFLQAIQIAGEKDLTIEFLLAFFTLYQVDPQIFVSTAFDAASLVGALTTPES